MVCGFLLFRGGGGFFLGVVGGFELRTAIEEVKWAASFHKGAASLYK